MSFLYQPTELLIEQLRYLPVQDLLNLCQTNLHLANLCRNPDLWRARIITDFPATDLRQIPNPQEAYLTEVQEPRSIYIHTFLPGNQPGYQLVPEEIIPDDRLFARVREIAEQTGEPYTIVYSRPIPSLDRPSVTVIALQNRNAVEYISEKPGLIPRITQIDILLLEDPTWNRTISYLAILRQRPKLRPEEQQTITRRDVILMREQIRGASRTMRDNVLSLHKSKNTPFYQRETQRAELAYQAELQRAFDNPIVPNLAPPPQVPGITLDERREALFNRISPAMYDFDREDLFLGFRSYQDFLNFQREYLNRLSESQIQLLELLLYEVLPISKHLDAENESVSTGMRNFVFDSEGSIVFIYLR